MSKIAILGWGSLLWDKAHREFDRHHGEWKFDGPVLKLEFSRKSGSRLDALTLVIDPVRGEACKVAYTLSKRRTVEKAWADLQAREGTSRRNIGCVFTDGTRRQGRYSDSVDVILRWAQGVSIDVVLWTDLPANFDNVRKDQFVNAAVDHVQRLSPEAKALAAEYLWRAPDFILTPLRTALQAAVVQETQGMTQSGVRPERDASTRFLLSETDPRAALEWAGYNPVVGNSELHAPKAGARP